MDELRLESGKNTINDVVAERGDDNLQAGKKQPFNSNNLIVERGGKFDFVNGDQLIDGSVPASNNRFSNGVKDDSAVTLPPISRRPKSAPTRSPFRPMPRRPVSAAPTQNPRYRVS